MLDASERPINVPPNFTDGVAGSRNVDQLLVVLGVSFHEATLNEVLNTLLDHLHVRFEEPDVSNDAADENVHRRGLQTLHVTNSHRINYMLPLHSDGLINRAHDAVLRLVFDHLLGSQLRDEVLLERVALEFHVYVDFFIRIVKVRLATSVLHDADLWFAQVCLESLPQGGVIDTEPVQELFHGDSVAVVEFHQNGALGDSDL